MEVYWISREGLSRHSAIEVPELLLREDGFLWLDIDQPDSACTRLMSEVLHFHPLGVRECQSRVPIPKMHIYADHFFMVFYSVEITPQGVMRLFQTSAFINERKYFVSVHGPGKFEPADLLERETEQVRDQIEHGSFRPGTPGELGHAIIDLMADRLEDCVVRVADEVSRLENSVARGRLREYERMLEGMFQVRHNLLTVRTIAAQSREVLGRMLAFSRGLADHSTVLLQDLLDHFERLRNVCDGEKELLQEVLDLYQTRVANDLSQLVRKLTAFGAILVADTLVAGIYGMNFDHMPELHWAWGYPFALGVMGVISVLMAIYFHRKDWL
ncbi:MAG: magnesium transporter CorA family protein [Panacagrimonas sp.]